MWYLILPLVLILISCSKQTLRSPSSNPLNSFNKSFREQTQNLKKRRPTVCSMTFNSKDERELFYTFLGSEFNHIELVQENNPDWLDHACKAEIKCDILIVSGHFGGSFFGSSKQRLSSTKLESYSCKNICADILKNPKEVFLFGCNTTAGKTLDHRTPEEYAETLYNEHREGYPTREIAAMAAAYRYSPLGKETKEIMQRTFPNAKIYGFRSTAPSGNNIREKLKKYLKSIPNYTHHLESKPKGRENFKWTESMKKLFIRSVDGIDKFNPICTLRSKIPIYKKLSWIDQIFQEEDKILTYAPYVNEYFSELEKKFGTDFSSWPREEQAYLERLQFNTNAKRKLTSFISNPLKGLIPAQTEILRLGERVGWYEKKEIKDLQRKLVGDLFKNNLTLEEKDRICSLGVQLKLELEDLPKEKWNKYTILALGCIRVRNEKIHLNFLKLLKDSKNDNFNSSVIALEKIRPNSKKAQLLFIDLLRSKDQKTRIAITKLLGIIKPKNEKIILTLIHSIQNSEPNLQHKLVNTLKRILPKGLKSQVALVDLLSNSNYGVRSSAVEILLRVKPTKEEVYSDLVLLLKSFDKEILRSVAETLMVLKPTHSSIHTKLINIIKNDNWRARSHIINILKSIKWVNIKNYNKIVEISNNKDSELQGVAEQILDHIQRRE